MVEYLHFMAPTKISDVSGARTAITMKARGPRKDVSQEYQEIVIEHNTTRSSIQRRQAIITRYTLCNWSIALSKIDLSLFVHCHLCALSINVVFLQRALARTNAVSFAIVKLL